MKDTSKRDAHIFRLWSEQKMTFLEISEVYIPEQLSLKRVRNIIYNGKMRLKNEYEMKIYGLFKLHFLESQNINMAIRHAWEHQPSRRFSERTIRYIINSQLRTRANQPNKQQSANNK